MRPQVFGAGHPAKGSDGVLDLRGFLVGEEHELEALAHPTELAAAGITAARTARRRSRIARTLAVAQRHRQIVIARCPPELGAVLLKPRGDIDALAASLRAISLLAHVESRTVTDAEINPLIVTQEGSGVVAVDGLVVFGESNGK